MSKKIVLINLFILVCCSFSLGQKLIYKDSIPEDRIISNYGPNKTHFIYLYIGNNLPVLNQENYKYSTSTINPQFGIAYKFKINEKLSSGVRLGYSFRKNEWKSESFRNIYQSNSNFDFLNTTNKFEAFNLSHESISTLFFRYASKKAGDRIPDYIELGVFAFFEISGKISAVVEEPIQGNYSITSEKRTYYPSHYNNDIRYGINLRKGVGLINLYTNFYLSDILSELNDPAYLDVGVEINLPFY
jgi:hypothetical protein